MSFNMEAKDLRFIVFMLNPDIPQYLKDRRIDTHDGEIFCSIEDAKDYADKALNDKLCTRIVIGVFVMDAQCERMGISCVETFGFRNDKKNTYQLDIFKSKLPN